MAEKKQGMAAWITTHGILSCADACRQRSHTHCNEYLSRRMSLLAVGMGRRQLSQRERPVYHRPQLAGLAPWRACLLLVVGGIRDYRVLDQS
jgi:hypothetical protein